MTLFLKGRIFEPLPHFISEIVSAAVTKSPLPVMTLKTWNQKSPVTYSSADFIISFIPCFCHLLLRESGKYALFIRVFVETVFCINFSGGFIWCFCVRIPVFVYFYVFCLFFWFICWFLSRMMDGGNGAEFL